MRKTVSYLNTDTEEVKVIAAFDRQGLTDNESTKDGRRVSYKVLCKACKDIVVINKSKLREGCLCPLCNFRWPPLLGMLESRKKELDHKNLITLVSIEKVTYWFNAPVGAALASLSVERAQTWISEGGAYKQFVLQGATGTVSEPKKLSKELIDGYNNSTSPSMLKAVAYRQPTPDEKPYQEPVPQVTRAPMPPRGPRPPPPPPAPKQVQENPLGLSDEEFQEILAKAKGGGTGMTPPHPLFSPPTASRWILVPKHVFDEFQRLAPSMSKTELASWGVVKHRLVIEKDAAYSEALAEPHWVYAYEAPVANVPDF